MVINFDLQKTRKGLREGEAAFYAECGSYNTASLTAEHRTSRAPPGSRCAELGRLQRVDTR